MYTAWCTNIYKGTSAYSKLLTTRSSLTFFISRSQPPILVTPTQLLLVLNLKVEHLKPQEWKHVSPDGCNIFQTPPPQKKTKKKHSQKASTQEMVNCSDILAVAPPRRFTHFLSQCPLWADISCVYSYLL